MAFPDDLFGVLLIAIPLTVLSVLIFTFGVPLSLWYFVLVPIPSWLYVRFRA